MGLAHVRRSQCRLLVAGSIQMLPYASHFGCPSKHDRSQYPRMYQCMWAIFREQYQALAVDPALNERTTRRSSRVGLVRQHIRTWAQVLLLASHSYPQPLDRGPVHSK
jgi:hypothetical protein